MDEISVEKVGQLLLEVPQLLAAAAGDQLVQGQSLLLRAQAAELLHRGVQPADKGSAGHCVKVP